MEHSQINDGRRQGSLEYSSKIERLGAFSIVGLALSIPISTAATNGCMVLLVSSFFLSGNWQGKWAYYKNHPVLPYVLALYGLFLFGLTYSTASLENRLHGFTDQSKLLYYPILLWYCRQSATATRVIWAIIIAMSITWLLGSLKFYFELPLGSKYSEAAVFKNHIKTNFFMAFAAFLALHQSVYFSKLRKYLPFLALLMVHYCYFMSMGRTGYAMMLLLVMLFAWQQLRWRGVALGCLFFTIIIGTSYLLSETFYNRVAYVSCELVENPHLIPGCAGSEVVESDTPTSIEYRVDFIKTAVHLIQNRMLFGYGTGSFSEAYNEASERLQTEMTDNPHNEYLHIWVELGLVGLTGFLAFFVAQARALHLYPPAQQRIAQAVLLGFAVGCLANSWLLDFSEIHFWMLLLALGTRDYRVKL